MNKVKIYISVILSILINFSIFYAIEKKSNKWELDQSTLKTGSSNKGIIENINLVTAPSKTVAKAQQSNSKPAAAKSTQKLVKADKPQVTKAVDTEKVKQERDAAPATMAASGKNSPRITQSARLQSTPPPIAYPAGAIEQNAIGKVSLRAFIDADGKIGHIEIISSSGYKILDDAAIEWFRQLSFYPARNDTGVTGSYVSQTISFSLNNAVDDAG